MKKNICLFSSSNLEDQSICSYWLISMSRCQSVSQLRIEIWRRAVFRNETWRCCRASLRKIIGKNFLLWSSSNLPIFIHVSWLISNHYARRRHISTPSWDTEHYLPIMFPHHHQSSSNSKIKECKKKRREKGFRFQYLFGLPERPTGRNGPCINDISKNVNVARTSIFHSRFLFPLEVWRAILKHFCFIFHYLVRDYSFHHRVPK